MTLSGSGGHTSRPHLTEDLTYALGKVVTELPSILSRRLDPRAGVSVVWGMVRAGSPRTTSSRRPAGSGGTVRMLDAIAWSEAETPRTWSSRSSSRTASTPRSTYQRGVPPVVNHVESTARLLGTAVERVLGPARARLHRAEPRWRGLRAGTSTRSRGDGPPRTRTPGGPTYDLHQGNLRVDEAATGIAARVLAEAAVTALSD